jgi:hypothetical protein
MTPDHLGTTRIEEFAETFASAFRSDDPEIGNELIVIRVGYIRWLFE